MKKKDQCATTCCRCFNRGPALRSDVSIQVAETIQVDSLIGDFQVPGLHEASGCRFLPELPFFVLQKGLGLGNEKKHGFYHFYTFFQSFDHVIMYISFSEF